MQVQKDFSLKKYNTFGINAIAEYFSTFFNVDELKSIIENNEKIISKMILGGGSNILFTKDFHGLVLKNEICGMNIIKEDKNYVYVKAGGGVKWHNLVMFCVRKNLGGLENLSLIPGNVGASPMQNIGAYGVEIKDVFHELEAFHLKEKEVETFSASDCRFGYRDSVFKNKYKDQFAILNVTYRLRKNPDFNISYGALQAELEKMNIVHLSVKAISDAVISIRSSKLPDPAIIGNAGSFFKNPAISSHQLYELHRLHEHEEKDIPFYKLDEENFKIPAGWLIEKCGWKGYRKDDAGCYEKQALVLVNYGNATGIEIYNLSEKIKISVKEKFGIELEREVNIL
jgi:UDP-N-acetylmuramate dehydrogenase